MKPLAALLALMIASSQAAEPILRPPGFRPRSPGVEAITATAVFADPTTRLSPGTILIRNGLIEAVGANVEIPKGARVWNLTNRTVYAGFIDPAVSLRSTNATRGMIASATHFFGVENRTNNHVGLEASRVAPHRRAIEGYSPDERERESMRELGFTAGNVLGDRGIFRGSSGVVLFSEENPHAAVVKDRVFQFVAFETAGRDGGYPSSLMGVLALIRQTFYDARFYNAQPDAQFEPALAALKESLSGDMPVLFEPRSALMVDQATRIAKEFGLKMVQLSSGQEWRRPELAEASKAAFIVPLNFPEIPKLPDEDDWMDISLDRLRAWDWAPENAALLRQRGLEVALTTRSLADKKNFRKNLRLAVDRGFSEADAIAALTIVPARLCGLEEKLGSIAPGKIANLTVVENEGIFQATNKVTEVWISGELFRVALPEEKKPVERDSKIAEADKEAKEREEKKAAERRALMIKRVAKSPQEGRGPKDSPDAVFVKNGTVWTSGSNGILAETDVLFMGGKIHSIGKGLMPPDNAMIIDASGKHVTPGLIDCHSHSILLSVNEGTLPSSAMVRMSEMVNSETRNIEQELAGGLTVANLLHGSANPIGGQNCVIKLRDGLLPEKMIFEGAPEGIKFALGENVKQSAADGPRNRFPQSRMGVPVFIRNRFLAARAYAEAMRNAPDKTRRDLELDAIVEIIEGKRLLHCHSYRGDEIIAFLRVMEEFNVKVATLQHVLEGYKVADEMAKHGVGGSTFSDWFNYKYEVIDAIPYNGALMHERGVLVSFNSDSSDLARRLYAEAAKAVKYGGVPEAEALKFVTLNPAKQLRIDSRVGSLEVGKDADFVIWSKSPLDTATVCLETWIEGKKYFDRAAIPARSEALENERSALLAKARRSAATRTGERSEAAEAKFFETPLELMHESHDLHCDDE